MSGPFERSLVPSSLIDDCIEVHLARHAPSGHALYLTTLALVLATAAALPLVHVPLTVQADGIVRPIMERQEARAAESGIVQSVHIADGGRVSAGDTLLTLDVTSIAARLALLDSIAHSEAADLSDLATLLDTNDSTLYTADVRTPHRRQQLREHAAVQRELRARAAVEQREAERLEQLYARGFATGEHVERQQAILRETSAAVDEHRERSRSEWSGAYARGVQEMRRLDAERAGLLETASRYAVVAPIAGTVELGTALSPGSVLQRGEHVATVSPNTELIGEALVAPRDIGLVRPGMRARLMIDAFNYRDWGTVDAAVSDISDDALAGSETPLFRVRCRLERTELRLPGGQRASLKKGMTFRARFVVVDRSLLQLIFDDVDGWLNPARASTSTAAAR